MMTRGELTAGTVVAMAAAVLAVALVWITRTTLRLEEAQTEALRLAAQEEKVRLALWRLDSALTAIIGRENSLPAEQFTRSSPGEAEASLLTRNRFETAPGEGGVLVEELAAALVQAPAVPEPLPDPAPPEPTPPAYLTARPQPGPGDPWTELQESLNLNEFLQRSKAAESQGVLLETVPPGRVETPFQAVWVGEDLYLVRRVRRGGGVRFQGMRIEWPELRAWLLGEIFDLLPEADLLPVTRGEKADPGRNLASLPLRLVPGPFPAPLTAVWTPVRMTVAISSGAIVLAVAAVALLFLGSARQSRRRADFVSAVTHELRTPLTTFRMYTEMLAEGIVAPDQQREYLETLRAEADRLGDLVENVLAYARLERRSRRIEPEPVDLEVLLEDLEDRLGEPAARGGFEIVIHPAGEAEGALVKVDRGAIERILLNWVDNACKYAADAEDRRLEIQPLRQGSSVLLRLWDHGPGIPKTERRRIFRPFHKSAHRAAATAPGVGLGLALSRGLARRQGGDLRLIDLTEGGAAFELKLPALWEE